jgi:hypothetical protein
MFVGVGGLMSLGVDFINQFRRVAGYIDCGRAAEQRDERAPVSCTICSPMLALNCSKLPMERRES